METKIVHCKQEKFNYYIGRKHRDFPEGSIFGNPLIIGRDGDRETVIRKYRKWLLGSLVIEGAEPPQISRVRALHGHTLSCWCKTKKAPDTPCHGDVLKEIADAKSYLHYLFEHTVHESWNRYLLDQFRTPALTNLSEFLSSLPTPLWSPRPLRVFRALKMPLKQVRVVILGQDPYPTEGQALGLAFGVPQATEKLPPTLINICKEVEADTGNVVTDLTLRSWARQGVLLLNTALTTEVGKMFAHGNLGWSPFTDQIISTLSAKRRNLVFVLWGKKAEAKLSLIDQDKHKVLIAGHPSPMSVKLFTGCRHFSKTNKYLQKHGFSTIQW
jgi:uracil-DNA glycosylase